MADPAHTTSAAAGYGYKQLFYEPLLGRGIVTALSVPLILGVGSLASAIASAIATAAVWGISRNRRAHSRPVVELGPYPRPGRGPRPAFRASTYSAVVAGSAVRLPRAWSVASVTDRAAAGRRSCPPQRSLGVSAWPATAV
ncbi:hypothetical protein GCM10023320_38050 [Pseudonocardia adelaidensis]|uniref:Uncharacterized protein n=1 Tax=Pseudonocardia adelaidensis TaxID=648754 RepID=A0ABP9NS17_9PSEU